MKTEVKVLKDTLSSEQDKLKTLQSKYDNTKESLKGSKSDLAKARVGCGSCSWEHDLHYVSEASKL